MSEESFRADLRRALDEKPAPEHLRLRIVDRLDRIERAGRRRSGWRWVALAACLFLCLGGIWLSRSPSASALAQDMVRHHEVCWNIPASPGREHAYQAWVSRHPARRLELAERFLAMLTEVDRRNCPFSEEAHGPHWMARDAGGHAISLYMAPRTEVRGLPELAAKPRIERLEGYSVLTWEADGCVWGMVAQVDAAQMRAWLQQISAGGKGFAVRDFRAARPLR